MAGSEQMVGLLSNKRALPAGLLGLAGLFLLLSFAVGWYSVDVVLNTYTFDQENAPTFAGPAKRPPFRIDLELHMLSVQTTANPRALQEAIESREPPSYDEDAGRVGTVLLGVLMMQLVVLVSFAAVAGFFYLQRRRRNDYSRVLKRLFVLLFVLISVCLLYFSLSIGDQADQDVAVIMDKYRPLPAAYEPPVPDLGFYQTWRSNYETINVQGENEVWRFVVSSNPSAGWWLTLGAGVLALAARITAARYGEFDEPLEPVTSSTKAAAPG